MNEFIIEGRGVSEQGPTRPVACVELSVLPDTCHVGRSVVGRMFDTESCAWLTSGESNMAQVATGWQKDGNRAQLEMACLELSSSAPVLHDASCWYMLVYQLVGRMFDPGSVLRRFAWLTKHWCDTGRSCLSCSTGNKSIFGRSIKI